MEHHFFWTSIDITINRNAITIDRSIKVLDGKTYRYSLFSVFKNLYCIKYIPFPFAYRHHLIDPTLLLLAKSLAVLPHKLSHLYCANGKSWRMSGKSKNYDILSAQNSKNSTKKKTSKSPAITKIHIIYTKASARVLQQCS